jgi:tetratricopeptide (TPR) repeat protein
MPAPVITTPRFPEFLTPAVPAALAASPAVVVHDRGWRFLQAGDFRNADRELGLAVRADPAFYPAEAAAGYLALAQKDPASALTRFERALSLDAGYVPALVGRGRTLMALDREADALAMFEAAIAADPSLADIRRQVEVLRFRAVEQNVAAARAAAAAGRADEAVRAYEAAIGSSPESAFLFRELAAVERQRGEAERALTHLRKASELDPSDAQSRAQVGQILEERGDVEAALAEYDASLALEPNDAVEARRDELRDRLAFSRLPAEYQAIGDASEITRGDLAALIGLRLPSVLQASANAVVVTDVRGNWAEPWIMAVAVAGVLEPFDNHTFQPQAVVRRVDLAQAVSRLVARIASPEEVRSWQSARDRFSDLSNGHLAYPAASLAVGSGVMGMEPDGRFDPSRPVTGAEAIAVMERLERLAKQPAAARRP